MTTNENGRKDPVINRRIVESVNIYEITELELQKLEEGSPATIQLNFSIGLLTVALTLIVAILTTQITSEKTLTAFYVGIFAGGVMGVYFFIEWYRKKGSVTVLIEDIKQRKIEDTSNLGVYEMAPFLRQIRALEKDNQFLSISWLKNTVFQDMPEMKEALQICLDKQYLTVYKIENPKKPGNRKVACCKINVANKEVLKVLNP